MIEQGHKPSVQEGFKQASKLWKLMTPLQKKQYSEKAQLQRSLYEARLVEREQLGYFTFPDGSRSTDPVNKDRVNPCEKYPEVTVSYERSPVLSKTASPQAKSLTEATWFPKEKTTRVKSAYNYFAMHLFATSRSNGFKITMKEVAAQWRHLNPEEREKFKPKEEEEPAAREPETEKTSDILTVPREQESTKAHEVSEEAGAELMKCV